MRSISLADKFIEQFKIIGDLERLISKVATLRINPRECGVLKDALYSLIPVKIFATTLLIRYLKR